MQPLLQLKNSIKCSECVFVVTGIQREMCMCHTVLCDWSGSKYFSTISHKWHDFFFGGGDEHKMCILVFSTTSV